MKKASISVSVISKGFIQAFPKSPIYHGNKDAYMRK